ncbi:MAG TPA: YciI family protein [Chitinophaga sp.]|uniref:YciI family protein n=1 Tax=Chitinophaga sp. TaxID=1869181 RepID=UPI002F94CC15
MKDFMFIFRGGSSAGQLSPEEMQDNMQQWFAWIEQFRSKNIYVGGEPLYPPGKMVSGSKAVVTDGPFAESKELVGGYMIIQADSLEAAAELAKGCPDLPLNGSVEVREVMKFDGM